MTENIAEAFFLTFCLVLLIKRTMKEKFITVLLFLFIFDFIFFVAVFGGSSMDIIQSTYMLAPFSLSLIIDVQIILSFFLRNKSVYHVFFLSIVPPVLFFIWDFDFIIPSHPLFMFYQYNYLYKILPRFNVNLVNIIIIYTLPFCSLLPRRITIPFIFIVFLICFLNESLIPQKKLGFKILIVQTGMFLSTHDKVVELRNEIFKHDDADIIIFSESPDIGFKEGSRTAFTKEFLNEIKNKHDDKLYIINNYGFIDGKNKKYNYNLSLYVMNGRTFIKAKSKLVPFWETPSFFYRESDWESPFFSTPVINNGGKYKFRHTYIKSYICYEAMFANYVADENDLTIIQSNYGSFKKSYDRVVKNGNVMAYVNKSSGFNNFISVQNMGGTIFVDNTGKFNWDVYETSKKQSVFILDI